MPTPHAQRAAAPHAQPAPHAHRDFDDAVTQPLTTADTALAAAAEGCAPNSPAGAASRARPEDAASAPRGSGNAQPGRAAAAAQRLTELDVLRALALSGILFVNIPQVMLMTGIVDREPLPMRHVLDLLVQQRFFPIFSLLFGVGFGIFLHRSAARAARPRVLLLRRLLLLAVFGAAHHVLQPGEALLPYAIAGVVVLLPLSFAPRWVNLAGGTVLLVLAAAVSGGLTLIPGLFLIGAALGRGDVARVLRCDVRVLAATAAVAVASAIGTSLWQEQDPLSAGFTTSSAGGGLGTGGGEGNGAPVGVGTPARGGSTRTGEHTAEIPSQNEFRRRLLV